MKIYQFEYICHSIIVKILSITVIIFSLATSCNKPTKVKEEYRFKTEEGKIIILYEDYSWEFGNSSQNNQYSASLRPISSLESSSSENGLRSDIEVIIDDKTKNKALQMKRQGWKYIMPRPKSKDADWTITDGRTTWYNGFWNNENTQKRSLKEPKLSKTGDYIGDEKGVEEWRKGGRPRNPTFIEYLLSESGGIEPKK